LARKPIEKGLTIAQNCLKWGTGGLDIDGSRVSTDDDLSARYKTSFQDGNSPFVSISDANPEKRIAIEQPIGLKQGRFPANVIHDGSDCVLDLFPESKRIEKRDKKVESGKNSIFTTHKSGDLSPLYKDTGSAARFFYCAKASQSERNAGLADFEDKQVRTTYDKKVRDAHDNDCG